jgi:hypothetical protein
LFASDNSKLPPPRKGDSSIVFPSGINVFNTLIARVFPPGYRRGDLDAITNLIRYCYAGPFLKRIRSAPPGNEPIAKMTKTITYTTMTVPDYLTKFSGRLGIGHDDIYDRMKPIKIAESNRDYVWCKVIGLQEDFIRTILTKDAVPTFLICNNKVIDAGNRSTLLWLFHNNKIMVDDMTFNDLPRELFGNWSGCPMPFTIIEGATQEEMDEYYEKFNKGVVLTFGQKLENRASYPLIAMANSMIGRGGNFPFSDLYRRVFQQAWKKTDGRSELAFAFQVLVASTFGRTKFNTKFTEHIDLIKNTTADKIDLSNLRMLCEIIDSADPNRTAPKPKKRAAFKKFIPAMIYDAGGGMPVDVLSAKWSQFFSDAYTTLTKEQLKSLVDVGTARAKTFGRIGAVSVKVQEYLDTRIVPIADDDVVENDDEDDDDEST